ncbi:hypothetical protein MUK42_05233 [Musa troglodytarum]|uniref:Uncharacterized protein n=1 Tax=Musa troglodytarum TaxID=320322 RepID=A0A9E7EUK6_9LILI|nr:hypothetical protein MUK42_05233 [Musa troglodytarum]
MRPSTGGTWGGCTGCWCRTWSGGSTARRSTST